MKNEAKRRESISPQSELYFDAIWEYKHLLSEESQNAMMEYGFRYLGLEPERNFERKDGLRLDKLRSENVIKQIEAILQNPKPTNNQRCFLVGRLGCEQVGYSEEEILEIIEEHNLWLDYSRRKTEYHVRKLMDKLR